MSVTHITGDLLDWRAGPHDWNVIVSGVNAQRVMGAGLAKAIRDRWPVVWDVYQAEAQAGGLRLGTFIVADIGEGRKVVSLVSQNRYGTDRRHLDYEALYTGLETLRDVLNAAHAEGRVYSLGIPHGLGCGLAGGAWPIVQQIIHFLFDSSPINCYIVQKS